MDFSEVDHYINVFAQTLAEDPGYRASVADRYELENIFSKMFKLADNMKRFATAIAAPPKQDDPQRVDSADDSVEETPRKRQTPDFIVQFVHRAVSDLNHYIANAAAATGVKISSSELVIDRGIKAVTHHDWQPVTPQELRDQVQMSIRRPAPEVVVQR